MTARQLYTSPHIVRQGRPAAAQRERFSIDVSHSFCVGSRQSPGEDPSVNMQSPFFSPRRPFFAASQPAEDKQLDCFSQTSPVSVSVTVPFPQST